MSVSQVAAHLAAAGLGGLAVGIEREWSARQRGRRHDFAGVRTFLLLGLLGGLAAELAQQGLRWAAAVLLGGCVLLVVAAYVVAALHDDLEATTEVAAFIVLAGGVLAGLGQLALAGGLCALTALVLAEKGRIHGLVFALKSEELEAGLRFAVLALVVLPLVPAGPFGPEPGFQPREMWALVLVFSGLSFAGYAGLRIAGPEKGYALAGLLGGLVSSTAVTLEFSRQSKREPALGRALALGVLAACTLVGLRVVAIAIAITPDVGLGALAYILPPTAAGAALAAFLLLRPSGDGTSQPELSNPLRLGSALRLALLFQLVLYVLHWARGAFGEAGVLGTAALLGLTDMDALTFSMAKLGAEPAQTAVAARALGVGLLANTVLKASLALVLGAGALRRIAGPALLLMAAVGGLALLMF